MVTSGKQFPTVLREVRGAPSVNQISTPLSKCKNLPKNTMENVYHHNMSIYVPSFYGSAGMDIGGKISREELKTEAGVESVVRKQKILLRGL